MLNLTTVGISIKSNSSHVKVGNVEITNYQMKKCATQLIKLMDPLLWEIIHCFIVYHNLPHSMNSRRLLKYKTNFIDSNKKNLNWFLFCFIIIFIIYVFPFSEFS